MKSTNQAVRYQLNTTTRELTITGAGSTIVVEGFDAGDLGISAPAPSVPAVPTAQYVFDLSTSAGRSGLDALTHQQRQANLRLNNAVFANGLYLGASTGSGKDSYLIETSGGADPIHDTQGANVLLFAARGVPADWSTNFDEARGAWLIADGYVIRQYTAAGYISAANSSQVLDAASLDWRFFLRD